MPGDPKECQLHARNCRRLAITAENADVAKRFQYLAHMWDSLAARDVRTFLATLNDMDSARTEPRPRAACRE